MAATDTGDYNESKHCSFLFFTVNFIFWSGIFLQQFFWSKLPPERIQHTVWKELSTDLTTLDSPLSSGFEETDEDDDDTWSTEEQQSLSKSKVQLDTDELERLFKKSPVNNQLKPAGNAPGVTLTPARKARKPCAVTLLDFNRANNIGMSERKRIPKYQS